jgi:hypothetical protein
MCVFITAVPITKLFALGEDSGGHVLRETTSRGLSATCLQSSSAPYFIALLTNLLSAESSNLVNSKSNFQLKGRALALTL